MSSSTPRLSALSPTLRFSAALQTACCWSCAPASPPFRAPSSAKKNLEAVNAHILGVVMNGYNGTQSGRRDGYSYAYSYSYYDEDKKGNDA